MQGQVGTCIVKSRENTDILNDHTVQARLIQLFYKPDKIRKLILAGNDIGGQIDLRLEDMRLCQLLEEKIGREAVVAAIDEEAGMDLHFKCYPKCADYFARLRERLIALL